ncbi:MAG: hypothetical protein ACRDKD_06950 [Solirubrobacteraceae bacterium]
MSGLILVVLGAWGGLVPLIGPYFGYAFGSHATWDLTMNRFWLDVLPGATVLVGGLMLMWSGHRLSGTVASWLAMAGGAWFAVGPAVSRLWEHGAGPIGAPLFGHVRQTFELIGYFYGLGAVVIGLAAFALGRIVTRPALVAEPVAGPAMAATEPVAAEPVAAEPVAAEPVAAEPVAAEPVAAEPVARRRPITGDTGQEAAPAESERVPAHH